MEQIKDPTWIPARLIWQQWRRLMTQTTQLYEARKTIDETMAWDIYFGSICAMAFHPGNLHNEIDLQKLADLCDTMITIRRERCQLSQRES